MVTTEEIGITELRLLSTVIKEKYNYDFSNYAVSSYRRRIARILEMFKVPSVNKLIAQIKEDPSFFKTFLSEMTVNVTEMFRDPSLWRYLRESVIPNILTNHQEIKIWHAGCSSGEEVFSMAILLKEMDMLDRAKIYATDIDTDVIRKAKEGKYAVKNVNEVYAKNYIRFQGAGELSDYYTENNGMAFFDKNLVKNVLWKEHNLVLGQEFFRFDIILCRNVLIYFNQQLQNEVINLFHKSLFNYGYMVIGNKESIIWCDAASKLITVNNEEKVFKKVRD